MCGGILLKNVKKAFILAAVCAALGGTALHFLYDLLPNPLTALIAPVNESVWEHLKLLYTPTLIAAFVLSRRAEDVYRLWGAFFAAVLVMPLVLSALYYLLLCAFGVMSLWVDIGLYYAVMAGGFALAYRLYRNGRAEKIAGFLLMLVILYGACLILFSFAAPPLPIFSEPITNAGGT